MPELDSELLRDLVKAAGGHRQAVKVLRRLSAELAKGRNVVGAQLRVMNAWADAIEQADEVREPRAGDAVIVRGQIDHLVEPEGIAVLKINRPDPMGTPYFCVQAGSLEHDTAVADGGVPG